MRKNCRPRAVQTKDDDYTWANAFAVEIATLNTPPCFAGFCDWRLPNRFELETLVNLGTWIPAVSPAFNAGRVASCTVLSCSCTASEYYWSSSSEGQNPGGAWEVEFNDGFVATDDKGVPRRIRAVRGGS